MYPQPLRYRHIHIHLTIAHARCRLKVHITLSNSRECMGVNREAMQLPIVYIKNPAFSTISHTRICIRYYKLCHMCCIWMRNEIKFLYDNTIVPAKLYQKNITPLLLSALLLVFCTHNNTEGKKLILLFGMALYCSDTYMYLTHANVWESMGKPCRCMQFITSRNCYYK